MLVMTDTAAMIVREITGGAKRTSGLRISRNAADGGLDLTLTDRPRATDRVIEEDGAAVFVAAEVVPPLTGTTLDVSIDAADRTATFMVRERPSRRRGRT